MLQKILKLINLISFSKENKIILWKKHISINFDNKKKYIHSQIWTMVFWTCRYGLNLSAIKPSVWNTNICVFVLYVNIEKAVAWIVWYEELIFYSNMCYHAWKWNEYDFSIDIRVHFYEIENWFYCMNQTMLLLWIIHIACKDYFVFNECIPTL